MSANPYDPVTTTDSTQLADDDWGLTLPPLRYKRFSGTSRLKSVCFGIKQHPKCLAITLLAIGLALLLVIVISVASGSHSNDREPTGNEPKWKKTDKGVEFYPVPEDGTIVLSFNPEKFYKTADQPIEKQLNEKVKQHLNNSRWIEATTVQTGSIQLAIVSAYLISSQLDHPYTDCNATYSPPDKVCRVSSVAFGEDCKKFNHYGYYAGQPCILLQLVLPENLKIAPITKDSPLWNAEQLASTTEVPYDPDNIPITCQGVTALDNLLLKPHPPFTHPFEYSPSKGFPAYIYRPRMASLPHLRPAVMVRLTTLLDRKLVHVTCTVWGQLYDFSNELRSHALLKTNFAVFIDH